MLLPTNFTRSASLPGQFPNPSWPIGPPNQAANPFFVPKPIPLAPKSIEQPDAPTHHLISLTAPESLAQQLNDSPSDNNNKPETGLTAAVPWSCMWHSNIHRSGAPMLLCYTH